VVRYSLEKRSESSETHYVPSSGHPVFIQFFTFSSSVFSGRILSGMPSGIRRLLEAGISEQEQTTS
jgi:hypothetical protein